MSFVRKTMFSLALCGLAQPTFAAEDSAFLARVRAVLIAPDVKTSPDIDADVDNKTIPEVDFSYFITPQIALELVLTYPQRHDVTVGGDKIGSVKHLPPTLNLQYHLPVSPWFKPYAGIGLNYTFFTDVDLAGGALDVDKHSIGPSFQLGFDVPFGNGFVFNVDVKKVLMSTDVKDASTGDKVTKLTIDPLLVGIGVGMQF
jgi:outer membrane protein